MVSISEILKSELFKSEKILEATLIDDLSSIHLTLRKNNEFEIVSRYYLGPDDSFEGKYEIVQKNIIFKNRPFDNDFIPDTVTIFEDKIYLRLKDDGSPDLNFANFDINSNQLEGFHKK